MTDAQIFEKLFNGGNYALPYLIKFTHETAGSICLVNNNEDIEYNGEVYTATAFDYCPPDNNGSGATLNITSVNGDNDLFEFIENADQCYKLQVVGVLAEGNIIAPLRSYTHFYGSVTIDEKGNIEFNLSGDDRLNMTFTPYVYDTTNNPGNA